MWDEEEFVVVPRMIFSLVTAVVVCAMTNENGHRTIQTDAGLSISLMNSKLTPALYYTKQKSGIYDTHLLNFYSILNHSDALKCPLCLRGSILSAHECSPLLITWPALASLLLWCPVVTCWSTPLVMPTKGALPLELQGAKAATAVPVIVCVKVPCPVSETKVHAMPVSPLAAAETVAAMARCTSCCLVRGLEVPWWSQKPE